MSHEVLPSHLKSHLPPATIPRTAMALWSSGEPRLASVPGIDKLGQSVRDSRSSRANYRQVSRRDSPKRLHFDPTTVEAAPLCCRQGRGMDPNLFHLDWERTTEVLGAIVVLSLFVIGLRALRSRTAPKFSRHPSRSTVKCAHSRAVTSLNPRRSPRGWMPLLRLTSLPTSARAAGFHSRMLASRTRQHPSRSRVAASPSFQVPSVDTSAPPLIDSSRIVLG